MKSLKDVLFPIARRFVPRKWFFPLSHIYLSAQNVLKYGDPHHFYCVGIEISTYCNRKCYYCPNAIYQTPEEYMSEEVFSKALERLKEIRYSGIVDYSFYNEPLMDKRLPELVKMTKDALPKAIIRIYTNGDFLTPEYAKQLIDAGVITFSITQHDKNETLFARHMEPILAKYSQHIVLNCLHDGAAGNRGGAIDFENVVTPDKCLPADHNLTITYTGDVLLCCNDYFRKYVFGNIMEESIPVIRNKEAFKKIRKEVRKGIARLEICRKCLGKDKPASKIKPGSHIKEL